MKLKFIWPQNHPLLRIDDVSNLTFWLLALRLFHLNLVFRTGDLTLEVIAGLFELTHAFANSTGQFGKLFSAEKKEDHDEDHDHFGTTEGSNECEILHRSGSS